MLGGRHLSSSHTGVGRAAPGNAPVLVGQKASDLPEPAGDRVGRHALWPRFLLAWRSARSNHPGCQQTRRDTPLSCVISSSLAKDLWGGRGVYERGVLVVALQACCAGEAQLLLTR